MKTETEKLYEEAIRRGGLRSTKQRREVFGVLLDKRDHPTATEIFQRTKTKIPAISLATVYNCLETLVECGLARQVHIDREPTRYCPNLSSHGHFVCTVCEEVWDIDIPSTNESNSPWCLPEGCAVTSSDVTLHGLCPRCNTKKSPFLNLT